MMREIAVIMNSGSKPVHFTWTAKIHVNGKNYDALKVLSIDNVQDYELEYSDVMMVKLAISGGTYAKDIYPFKDKVDITVYKTPISEVSTGTDTAVAVQSERYTATLVDTGNPIVEGNAGNTLSREALDLANIFEVTFQLVNKALEQIRMISVGGIYRNVKAIDVIKSVLTSEMQKIVVDGKRMPVGVDIVPGTNTAIRDHVVLPHGLRLVDLPEFIHKRCGGVYSTGFGYYLQGDHWYVYPCYDVNRFNTASRTLTILNVPRNKFSGIERTYRKASNSVFILATGEVKYRDDSEVQQLNYGNGVRFSDANNYMNNFSTTAGNKTTVNRGSNNTEVISSPRANGNNNIQMSSNSITANPFVEYSMLARRQGSFYTCVWENSDLTVITPGMPVKIMYMDDEILREVKGVVLKVHNFTSLRGSGMTETRYTSQTVISIFINQIKK